MLALTISQPWSFAIRHLGKNVENRDWAPPRNLKRFAIHAGKLDIASPKRVWTEIAAALSQIESAGLLETRPTRDHLIAESGAIVAVATLDRVSESGSGDEAEQSPWRAHGTRFAWCLKDIVCIDPVTCCGMQKLWTVPEVVAEIVRARVVDGIPAARPAVAESIGAP